MNPDNIERNYLQQEDLLSPELSTYYLEGIMLLEQENEKVLDTHRIQQLKILVETNNQCFEAASNKYDPQDVSWVNNWFIEKECADELAAYCVEWHCLKHEDSGLARDEDNLRLKLISMLPDIWSSFSQWTEVRDPYCKEIVEYALDYLNKACHQYCMDTPHYPPVPPLDIRLSTTVVYLRNAYVNLFCNLVSKTSRFQKGLDPLLHDLAGYGQEIDDYLYYVKLLFSADEDPFHVSLLDNPDRVKALDTTIEHFNTAYNQGSRPRGNPLWEKLPELPRCSKALQDDISIKLQELKSSPEGMFVRLFYLWTLNEQDVLVFHQDISEYLDLFEESLYQERDHYSYLIDNIDGLIDDFNSSLLNSEISYRLEPLPTLSDKFEEREARMHFTRPLSI